MPALLSIAHANKKYNGIPALIDISLDLNGGEIHALMGENGAGKSTLIKLLAGVLTADSAQFSMRGQPFNLNNPQTAFASGLRFIHQELNIVPQLSVAENVFMSHPYPRRAGFLVDWPRLHREAQNTLADLGITHLAPRTVLTRLSPGDQMLVKIAGAFLGGEAASIFVLDEPTAALSGGETDRLFGLLARLRERGCAILYVSHRMDEIFRIADHVSVLRDGRLVATKLIKETSPAELIQLMTGRNVQQLYPSRETPVGEAALLKVNDLRTDQVGGLTFDLHKGEIIGVAGLAGAGRTELVRALMGADPIRGGARILDGNPLKRVSPAESWGQGLAYVPEERRSQGLILSRRISHNVALPHLGALSGYGFLADSGRERRLAQESGEAVRLKARHVGQTVRELSGGNQQKVVFARALGRSPKVLLLDEPTRGVDVGAKADIYRLIRQASAEGIGIVLVSSDLPELIGLCDRILIMRRGGLDRIVPAAGLTEASLLALCYGESAL